MHRAYAKKAHVIVPTLEEYEKRMIAAENIIVPKPAAAARAANRPESQRDRLVK